MRRCYGAVNDKALRPGLHVILPPLTQELLGALFGSTAKGTQLLTATKDYNGVTEAADRKLQLWEELRSHLVVYPPVG